MKLNISRLMKYISASHGGVYKCDTIGHDDELST